MGLAALYVFMLFFQLNTTIAYIGLILMMLAFIFQMSRWLPVLKKDPVVYWFVLISVYMLLHAVWAAHVFPETRLSQKDALKNWMNCLMFIPVGWQLWRHMKHINRLLLVLAAGLMIRIVKQFDVGQFAERLLELNLGLNPITFGLFMGIAVLGLLLLAPRLNDRLPADKKRLRFFVWSLWLIGLLVFLEYLILSQTRAAWLAAVLVFPLALVFRYWAWMQTQFSFSRVLIVMAPLILAGLFIQLNSSFISSRIHEESEVRQTLTDHDFKAIPSTSIGHRLILWKIGLQKWSERPLLGWGTGTTEYLLNQVQDSRLQAPDGGNRYSHLHNYYLEVMLRLGLLGVLMFGGLTVVLVAGVWRAYSKGAIPFDYACFLLAGSAFTAIWSFFDFELFKYAWRNFSVIWLGLLYSVWLINRVNDPFKESF